MYFLAFHLCFVSLSCFTLLLDYYYRRPLPPSPPSSSCCLLIIVSRGPSSNQLVLVSMLYFHICHIFIFVASCARLSWTHCIVITEHRLCNMSLSLKFRCIAVHIQHMAGFNYLFCLRILMGYWKLDKYIGFVVRLRSYRFDNASFMASVR